MRHQARASQGPVSATIALCGALLAAAPAATAQLRPAGPVAGNYVHEVWSIEDGLPVNHVTAVLQARDGYLWLATFDGLVRFDGARFTVYNTGNRPDLPSNRIIALHEARDGALWLTHEHNWISRFADDSLINFQNGDGLRGVPSRAMLEDADGSIWIGTDRDVARYRDGRMETPLAEPIGIPVTALARSPDGAILIGLSSAAAHYGASLLRWAGDSVTAVTVVGTPNITALLPLADGTLWIGTRRGSFTLRDSVLAPVAGTAEPVVSFFAPAGRQPLLVHAGRTVYGARENRLEPHGTATGELSGIRIVGDVDPHGSRWIGAQEAVYRDGEVILTDVGELRGVAFDHEGSVWIAARGLHRLKPGLFTAYGAVDGGVDNVYPVYEDPDGTLWFGSFGWGLARYRDGRFTVYTLQDGVPGTLVLAIHRDRAGDLWVGAYNGTMCRFRLGEPCQRPQLLVGEIVRAIHEDQFGTLWVGTDDGLFRRVNGEWEAVGPEDGVPRVAVRVVHERAGGEIWFGTNGAGLLRHRPGHGFDQLRAAHGLSSDLIRAIYESGDGVLWIGTEGRGLARLALPADGDLHDARITSYRRRHGLYEEVIHQILEDDFGRLWMSSNRGIFWVERAQLDAFARGDIRRVHATHYTERDGLRNREANGGVNGAGVKARDGRLWFATQAGVAVVDPATIRRNTVPPPVAIEGVTAGPGVYRAGADGTVRLPTGRRDLEIAYTALSFFAPENVQFRYRLERFDDEWVLPGNRRTAFYTNIPPGRYVFRVLASNNDGVWNETGAAVAVVVPPFFYETRWFRALAILTLLGGLAGAAGLRLRQQRRREEELQQLVSERTSELEAEKEASEAARREAERHSGVAEQALATVATQAEELQELDRAKSRFFANVSHEFRTPLTLMIGPLEDLRAGLHGDVPDDVDRTVSVALRNARRLLHLVDQLLDVARLEANRVVLRARRGDLVQVLRNLLLAFSPVAERKRIASRLDEPDRPAQAWFDPDLIEKVFANLLGNAFKYTPDGGTVRVTVRVTVPVPGHPDFVDMPEGHVTVEVRDSGPGIPAADLPHVFDRFYRAAALQDAHGGTGIGLSLARELVELHRGRIAVDSEEGFGANFTVVLPLGCAHFDPGQLADPSEPSVARGDRGAVAASVVEAAIEPSHPAPDAADADPDARPTVLLIDDHPELRAFVTKHLVQAGYRVVEAGDGRSGLALAREIVPDCVISDIMMPGLDGHALCRAMRADPELDFVPVILLTAKADPSHRREGLEEGADDYLTKPFDTPELLARVANLIATRQRLRDRLPSPGSLHPAPVGVVSSDDAFLARVREVLEAHIADSEFSVDQLAHALGQSRSQLYRRLQEILDQPPSELLLQFRLERGADLLAGRAGTVSEIAYAVGFKSVSHFCRRFRTRYGVTPSAWAARVTPG